MTGSTRSSEGLDVRRRKLLFRAWHRGTREMDLILGRFADAAIADLSEAEIDDFERLLDVLGSATCSPGCTGNTAFRRSSTRRCSGKLCAFHQRSENR